jgi:hypothetical protein
VGADTAGTAEVAQIENDGWGPAVSLGFNPKKGWAFLAYTEFEPRINWIHAKEHTS